MKQLQLVLAMIVIIVSPQILFAQKNTCSYFSANPTDHTCAGDFRTFQVIADFCAEDMVVTVTGGSAEDVATVINYTTNQATRKSTFNIGLQAAYYSGPPHLVKTYLRTLTLTFRYLCCGSYYTQTRTIEVYNCPFR